MIDYKVVGRVINRAFNIKKQLIKNNSTMTKISSQNTTLKVYFITTSLPVECDIGIVEYILYRLRCGVNRTLQHYR